MQVRQDVGSGQAQGDYLRRVDRILDRFPVHQRGLDGRAFHVLDDQITIVIQLEAVEAAGQGRVALVSGEDRLFVERPVARVATLRVERDVMPGLFHEAQAR